MLSAFSAQYAGFHNLKRNLKLKCSVINQNDILGHHSCTIIQYSTGRVLLLSFCAPGISGDTRVGIIRIGN